MTTENRFAFLLAEKSTREKRIISIAQVSRDTGIAERTLQQWYKNTITRFDAQVIDALCNYLECNPGDLITIRH